ncbi:lysine decarboxylase LdcC [Acinetobacter sp. ANC 4558]|uniref:lysine decarboxylase n=1 Tax=Acinetobacter sp. ANC 4558 TaxID=1977876 RepID=UPI000A34898D|nr:lysine decarboxylase [Acinetobacter sp. ANC 4558]OTG82524.1 lysine decarboxylase LdcC [Acinetobacter sp. ANC 4558]
MSIIVTLINEHDKLKSEFLDCISNHLEKLNHTMLIVSNENDLYDSVKNNVRISGVIFFDDLKSKEIFETISHINSELPVFTFINNNTESDYSLYNINKSFYFFQYQLSSTADISDRISQIVDEYVDNLLPPLTKALFNYVKKDEYTFCTPGHMGGTAFESSPIGAVFYDFYGQNTMRSDVSISVSELGSLLDHSGPHREAEDLISETFNSDRSYIVTNGTSTANKIVGMYACPAGKTVLVDRNCHKSLTHLMMMTDVTPIYLIPTRNSYGILGGIPKQEFAKENIEKKVKETKNATWPVHAIITNSTYDGLFYKTDYIKKTLDVKSIHFDSAWVPYTNFHPIYANKAGMSGERVVGKTIYETQSTHKLLAAFSQASMIHVKGDFNERTFNETYMMHTTTSPLYSIVASCEVSAAMMKSNAGKKMVDESIELAIDFRREIKKLHDQTKDWFFDVWQPENIDKKECWPLDSINNWHGFKDIDDDHLFLDPIKVTLLTPGLDKHGNLQTDGIPASIVEKFLAEHGIIVEKTGPYSLLFLFSIGINRSKALTLLHKLAEFKILFDANETVSNVLPKLYNSDPVFYKTMRIKELADGIHKLVKHYNLPELMYNAFEHLPIMELTPHVAFQQEILGNAIECPLSELLNKVSANMILPYPPGIPVIMPGEKITEDNIEILKFLEMLCDIGSHYPGFETDIHGVYLNDDGEYVVKVLK